jgi:predicted negative regulator of RcsB-dependent stress response
MEGGAESKCFVRVSGVGDVSDHRSVALAALRLACEDIASGQLDAAERRLASIPAALRIELRMDEALARSSLALGRGDVRRALDAVSDALFEQPAHAGLRLHRGKVLAAMGRREEARADFRFAASERSLRGEAEHLLRALEDAAG